MISDTTINDPSGTLLCSHCYKTIYRNGDSDFSLNNDYDEVSLWYQNTLLDSMSYSGSTEGMSWSEVNDIWIETKPTPGKENEQSNSCDWELNIQTPSSIFEESPSFTLEANRLTGFAQNISVKGTITNLKGTILTSYAPWTQKAVTTKSSTTYSPNLAPGTYLISFYYNNLSCEDTNLKNNNVSTLIAIDSPPIQNTSLVHSLTLKQDNPFQWGDDFIISLSLFKGDTAKQRVDLWVEKDSKKVSSTISLNLLTKFQNYSLSLPLSLNQNCNQKITDGLAKIIVEGLDMHAEKEIIIENINPNNCESSSSSSTSSSTTSSSESSNRKKRSPTFQIVETPATIVAGDALRVKIQIENPSGNHEFHISNALYNKRKCLTCKENDTLSSSSSKISLKEGEIKVVDSLLLIPKTIQQGEYQLKVKIIKDNQKTVHQLETPIYIKDQPLTLSTAQEINSLKSTSISESPLQYLTSSKARHQDEQITGFVVYESNAQKTKKTIPYFIIITLALLSLVLVLRNGKKKISA